MIEVFGSLRYSIAIATAVLGLFGCKRPEVIDAAQHPPAQAAADRATVRAATGLPAAISETDLAPAATLTSIPFIARELSLDAHDDDPAWHDSGWTGPFLDGDGSEPARPYSNARFLWSDTALYMSLYAADQDISSTAGRAPADAFEVEIVAGAETRWLRFTPKGLVSAEKSAPAGRLPLQHGIRTSIDVDGSIDDPQGEDDEEWVVFVAVPWRDLGVTPQAIRDLQIHVKRCDTPKESPQRCGNWGRIGREGRLELRQGRELPGAATPTEKNP